MELAGSVQADSREIIHEGEDVNLEMVRAGHGLWYRRYAYELRVTDRAAYKSVEQQARKDRLGLWNDSQPVAPSDWRTRQRR